MYLRIAMTLGVALALISCASTGTGTTRMTADDLTEMSEAMAQSLAKSDAMRDRTPQSEPWVISIDKALNLSTDIITESERWYVIQRLRSTLPIRSLSREKNITLVIPKERLDAMKRNPKLDVSEDPNFGAQRQPTHQMTATFRGGVRADALNRTDSYYCEFEMIDLRTGIPAWIDKFEYKRAATGHIWD